MFIDREFMSRSTEKRGEGVKVKYKEKTKEKKESKEESKEGRKK